MAEIIALFITIGIFGGTILITWLCCTIYNWNYNRKAEKSIAKNVEFYAYIKECRQKSKEVSEAHIHEREIRQDIDTVIKELPYLSLNMRKQAEEDLETMREHLESYRRECVAPLEIQEKRMWEIQRAWQRKLEESGEKIY